MGVVSNSISSKENTKRTNKMCFLVLARCTCVSSVLSHVQLFVASWTVTHQALLSMGFSRQ